MTSNKRTKTTISETGKPVKTEMHPKSSSTFKILSFVCLIGALSQSVLSFKIVFIDKEFATLALSLVFFVVFSIFYFLFLVHSPVETKDFIFDSIIIVLLSCLISILLIVFLPNDKVTVIIATFFWTVFCLFLPLAGWLTSWLRRYQL
jgi:hypothetical protein